MNSARAMDVAVRRVRSSSCVPIDPFEPMLSAMAGNQILEVVSRGDALRFSGTEEVFLDWVGIVPKRHLDWALKTMNVAVVTCTLISLVLSHERDELLRSPALRLEVIIVGR